MTVVPVSLLSASDLLLLGNNLLPRRQPARRLSVAAINRSLAIHDEHVEQLYGGTNLAVRSLHKAA